MTPDERTQLRALAGRVRRIRAYSNERPHVFAEDKDELAHALEILAGSDADPQRRPERDLKLSFGPSLRRTVTANRGAQVIVERRGRSS